MASTETFTCSVVTPERVVLECDATFVAFPAHDGEIGILRNRAPLLCRLGIGQLRVTGPKETHALFIDGGFAQVVENRLTILTDQAMRVEDLDAETARAALAEARALEASGEASIAARDRAIDRARVELRLAPPPSES